MTYSSTNRGFPAGNPIANALVIIAGTLAIAVSIIIGFVAFVVLASIVLIMAAVIAIRIWWFNRKLRSGAKPGGRPATKTEAIEGEFVVVSRRGEEQR